MYAASLLLEIKCRFFFVTLVYKLYFILGQLFFKVITLL
jgi:hypothetical protein